MPRPTRSARFSASVLACVSVALSACGSHEPPRVVLAEHCVSLSGAQPVELQITPDSPGTLQITVQPKGIAVVARVTDNRPRDHQRVTEARSPVERFGVITFTSTLADTRPRRVVVRSIDSPGIVGQVCLSASQLDRDDRRRLRAEQSFAAAAVAVQAEDVERALALYRAAARDFDGLDRLRTAQARNALAELVYLKVRDDEGAYVLANWALADFGHKADPALRSGLLGLQARSLLESQSGDSAGRRRQVFDLLQSAQGLAEQSRFGAREVPRFTTLRGFMDYRAGNTTRAAALFERAAQQCEALQDWQCYARARQNTASLAEEAHNFTVALQAYTEAQRVLPPQIEPQLSADILSNLGRLQGTAGLFRQSERSHRAAIRLHGTIGNCEGARMGLARLGTLLVQVGSIGEARAYLGNAATLECRDLLSVARRTAYESNDDEATDATSTARDACAVVLPSETLTPAGRLAVFHAILGLREAFRLEGAEDRSRGCLAVAAAYAKTARTQLRLANAKGAALLEEREADEARRTFERGLRVADDGGIPATYEHRPPAYIGIARAALLEKQPAVAHDYAMKSLMLGSARADVGQMIDSLQLLARSVRGDNANESAASILRTATGLIEQVPIDDLDAEQRATWLATQHAAFAELTSLYASEAGTNEARAWQAFDISERGRTRSIRYAENQATDVRAARTEATPSSARYHDLMLQIASLVQPETAAAAPTSETLVSMLGELAARGETSSAATRPANLQQALKGLDATIVEYAVGREAMFAFVIDAEHIRVVPLGNRHEIAAAASMLYEGLRDPEASVSGVRGAARHVAELAWWPLAEHIHHRRVIFVPDDALHTVPFAVLPWSAANDSPLVVERVELSVVPSTLFITRNRGLRKLDGAERVELIGDPVFRRADWERECLGRQTRTAVTQTKSETGDPTRGARSLPRLPGSRKEIAAIAELAARSSLSLHVHEHLGCNATPRSLHEAAATHPTLLHIATHGYVDAYRPRLSALALTPDVDSDGQPGFFGLLDILNTQINSRLVVLSACDTSRGRLLPGEGVLGPAQAFLQAGAQSVIASYWRIADEATAPFMQAFYKYLLLERRTAASALRQAQLDFLRTGSPHDWAAFTLYGWPDTSL